MKTVLALLALSLTILSGCSQPEIGEYKPAIMVEETIYWLSPDGELQALPEGAFVVGQIESIAAQTHPPGAPWEAIGFSESFLGADIYQDKDGDRIYVYSDYVKGFLSLEIDREGG